MKIRTVYFKVNNMLQAVKFWKEFLRMSPVKTSDSYHEWRIENLNLGLVLNDIEDKWIGSNCVPVFEFADDEILNWVDRAKSLGASVILDALNDPDILSVVMADPWGNEFEVSKFH